MERTVVVGLVALVTAAVVNGVPRMIANRSDPSAVGEACGRICLPRGTALFFVALCLGFIGFGAFGAMAEPALAWAGLGLVVMFSYGIWSTVSATRNAGAVIWDDRGIEGPSRFYAIPFADNRDRIRWEDIASYERRAHGIVVLTSKDRRKLVWSHYYAGEDALRDLIRRKCPGVEVR